MKPVIGARPHGSGHAHAAVVVLEQELVGRVFGQREPALDLGWQVIVRKFHLVPEDHLGGAFILGNDAAALIGNKQGVIKPQNAKQGGRADLTGLENQIAVPDPGHQPLLGLVHAEKHLFICAQCIAGRLHEDVVEVLQPPLRIGQAHFQ